MKSTEKTDVILPLAKEFIRKFYAEGNLTGALEQASDDIVAFGTKSMRYAVGKEKVRTLMQKEYERIGSCRLFRLHLREHQEDGAWTATGVVVLRGSGQQARILHKLRLMYRLAEGGYELTGIHIVRDVSHEATYRMICDRMLAGHLETNRREHGAVREALVPSSLSSALVSYHMEDGRRMTGYGEELWQMLGYDSEDAFRKSSADRLMNLVDEEERAGVQDSIRSQLESRNVYQVEYRAHGANGRVLWMLECGRRTEGKGVCPWPPSYRAMLIDLTELKQEREALTYQASYDELTDLYNRAAFCREVQNLLVQFPCRDFEIMCVDIERFKVINDLFGEDVGDRILRYLAAFFKETGLKASVSARLHADKFLVFYPAEGSNRARFMKSLKLLASSFTLGYRIILRFGIYPVEDRTLPVSTMCDRAALALLKAKAGGMNDFAEYDEAMRSRMMTEQNIVNDMTEALARGEFVLYMQPKYNAVSELVVGAEALVRWEHPTRGQIPPSSFIPVFEHNGFIFQLDQFVWEEVCRLLRKWIDAGIEPHPVSVNVSRIDFYSTHLVTILEALVRKYDLPHRLLELEITESAYTENPRQLIRIVKELQERGFKILMDDFGNGYSSLNMLKELPVDVLKIDLKFLDDSNRKGRGGNILHSVVRMAKWMCVPVVVEGVETRQQVDFLRTIGCEYIQGYYFSHPLPIPEYEEILRKGSTAPEPVRERLDAEVLSEIMSPSRVGNLLFNSMIGGVGLYEMLGDDIELLRANDGLFHLLGDPMEGISKDAPLSSIIKEDRAVFLHTVQAACGQKRVAGCIVRCMTAGGSYLWLRARVSALTNDEKRSLFFIGWDDISSRYDLPKYMQTIVDNFTCGIVMGQLIDEDLYMTAANQWSMQRYGLEEDDPKMQGPILFAKILPAELLARVKTMIVEIGESGSTLPRPLDYRIHAPDGKDYNMRAYVYAVKRMTRHYDVIVSVHNLAEEDE